MKSCLVQAHDTEGVGIVDVQAVEMAAEWHRKSADSKNKAPRTVVHRAWKPGSLGWYSRSAHHPPIANSIRCFRSHLQLAAGLIRFFCQLEQYPHQFRVVKWLLTAE